MNPEVIVDLQKRLTVLEETLVFTKQAIQRVEIDNQSKLKANKSIAPGIATKVAYDSNGLIIKGSHLESSDIPLLQIDSIEGLRSLMDKKLSRDDITDLLLNNSSDGKKDESIFETGIKVNYNKDGVILSSSELLVDDIPVLPITHIDGLKDEIDIIKSGINPSSVVETAERKSIAPGTYPKITYDSDGRVISGSKLSIDDIPIDLITKINLIESTIPSLVSQRTIDGLHNDIKIKVDANQDITPGIYTKIKVDKKGLVVSGENITLKDLPEIKISDIVGLDSAIRNKASQDDLIALNETVSSIVSSMSSIGDLTSIKNDIKCKASSKEVKEIGTKVDSLQNLMDILSTKIPNELIMEQLQLIQNELSSISGRVSVLERKLNMDNDFDTEDE